MTTKSPKDRIRERAYALWEAEGRPDGRDLDVWLQAEREVGIDPPDLPVADAAPGPDETVETISDSPKESIVTLTQPAPESVEADG